MLLDYLINITYLYQNKGTFIIEDPYLYFIMIYIIEYLISSIITNF